MVMADCESQYKRERQRLMDVIKKTYSDVELLDSPAKFTGLVAKRLRAADVFAFAFLEHNAFVMSLTVEPSLLDLLLVKPANHDLAFCVGQVLVCDTGSWPGGPW
jgi:hypothetical protein